MNAPTTKPNRNWVAYARLAVGLLQGVGLYITIELFNAGTPKAGFAEQDWRHFVEASRTLVWFAPLPLLFGLGNMPAMRLVLWTVLAACLLALFGWLGPAPVWDQTASVLTVWLFSLIVLYILHEFVQSAHDDRSAIARYETYFDNAWRHGFQAILGLIFLGAFWVVVSLGAWLFNLIGLQSIREFIFSDEFRWLASGAAFALGLHITDAGSGLTRGARQLGLALLSWLAILMTLILTLFLLALPFTGLEALWDTNRATVLLLNAAATMILLINAAFQAGEPPASRIMRVIVRFSAAPLVGVVGLAAVGLWLRVDQYGLTPARVLASVQLFIVAFYGVGYVAAALRAGPWMALLKPVNTAAALLVALLLSLLMTPVLDPARVSVDNQVARLLNGDVEPEDFDFSFLANARSRHWGDRALEKLAARSGSERDDRIALFAQNPRKQEPYRDYVEQTLSDRRDAMHLIGPGVIPEEAFLPLEGEDPIESCLDGRRRYVESEQERIEAERSNNKQDKNTASLPSAVVDALDAAQAYNKDGRCPVRLIDVDFDGDDDLLIWDFYQYGYRAQTGVVKVLVQNKLGEWAFGGAITPSIVRDDNGGLNTLDGMGWEDRAVLLWDAFNQAKILPPAVKDLALDGFHIQLLPLQNALNMQEMRMRIAMESGVELHEFFLTHGPSTNLIANCRPPENTDRFRNGCYGRAINVVGDEEEEFIILQIRGRSAVTAQAYERQNSAWKYIGEGSQALDNLDTDQKTEKHTQVEEKGGALPLQLEQAQLADTLRAVEPRLGDLDFAGTRYVFAHPKKQNRRR